MPFQKNKLPNGVPSEPVARVAHQKPQENGQAVATLQAEGSSPKSPNDSKGKGKNKAALPPRLDTACDDVAQGLDGTRWKGKERATSSTTPTSSFATELNKNFKWSGEKNSALTSPSHPLGNYWEQSSIKALDTLTEVLTRNGSSSAGPSSSRKHNGYRPATSKPNLYQHLTQPTSLGSSQEPRLSAPLNLNHQTNSNIASTNSSQANSNVAFNHQTFGSFNELPYNTSPWNTPLQSQSGFGTGQNTIYGSQPGLPQTASSPSTRGSSRSRGFQPGLPNVVPSPTAQGVSYAHGLQSGTTNTETSPTAQGPSYTHGLESGIPNTETSPTAQSSSHSHGLPPGFVPVQPSPPVTGSSQSHGLSPTSNTSARSHNRSSTGASSSTVPLPSIANTGQPQLNGAHRLTGRLDPRFFESPFNNFHRELSSMLPGLGPQEQSYVSGLQTSSTRYYSQQGQQFALAHSTNGTTGVLQQQAQDSTNLMPMRRSSNAVNHYGPGSTGQGLYHHAYIVRSNRAAPCDHRIECALLNKMKENWKRNLREWALSEIVGHLAQFSNDYLGSMFIQAKIDAASADLRRVLFVEMRPNAFSLLCDTYGNFIVQKCLEYGDQVEKQNVVCSMKGRVVNLSLQTYSCRVVQKAIEHVLLDQKLEIVKELEGHVWELIDSDHGNYVIQKSIEAVPVDHIQFIIDDFLGRIRELAMDKYGCRVVQRLLEHCTEPLLASIMQELRTCGWELPTSEHGNFVAQHVLEYGSEDDRAFFADIVLRNILIFSKQKQASNVVESCLQHGTNQNRHDIMARICECSIAGSSRRGNALTSLIEDPFGNYVVQSLIETLQDEDWIAFLPVLERSLAQARHSGSTKIVNSVAQKLQRRLARTAQAAQAAQAAQPQQSSRRATQRRNRRRERRNQANSSSSSSLTSPTSATPDGAVSHTSSSTRSHSHSGSLSQALNGVVPSGADGGMLATNPQQYNDDHANYLGLALQSRYAPNHTTSNTGSRTLQPTGVSSVFSQSAATHPAPAPGGANGTGPLQLPDHQPIPSSDPTLAEPRRRRRPQQQCTVAINRGSYRPLSVAPLPAIVMRPNAPNNAHSSSSDQTAYTGTITPWHNFLVNENRDGSQVAGPSADPAEVDWNAGNVAWPSLREGHLNYPQWHRWQ